MPPHSTESSSLDDHTHTGPTTPYKEKDVYYAQEQGQDGDRDHDQLPTIGNDGGKPKAIVTPKSKGVVGMELLLSRMNVKYLVLLYGGFNLLSYTLSLGTSTLPSSFSSGIIMKLSSETDTTPLPCTHTDVIDQYTSGTYTTYATSESFKVHSLLSTIGVIRAIFQSISQPPMAKIADVFGRVNAYCLSVFLYVLGESSFERGCSGGGWGVFTVDKARER
jgi:hypothetical protein